MLRSRSCVGGMVSAPHHLAAQAGADVLRQGGNAIEAAVASAATIAVVYPHMNSIGGDGFWLISEPGKDPIAIQACGHAAQLATPCYYLGQGIKTIPTRGAAAALTAAGAISGWQAALRIAGDWSGLKLPVEMLLTDAIRHAKNGVPITESQQNLTKDKWDELHDSPGFSMGYAASGFPCTGDILKQSDLAATLEHLAEAGLDDFYRGDVARTIASGLESVGSPLRLVDLESFYSKLVEPLSLQLTGSTVYNLPPPTQGISSLMILGIFEYLQASNPESFSHIHSLVEATKAAFIMRNRYVEDPSIMSVDYRKWLHPSFLEEQATNLSRTEAMEWPHIAERGDTIWLGAADNKGRVVSYIQSIYWEFGSGVVVPDTGILWQNRGSSFSLSPGLRELASGRLPFHTLNPALAKFKDGRVLAYGTMGGEGQPQTQAALFTRYANYGVDLQAAITAPRWLLGKTWGDETANLKIESRFDDQLIDRLVNAGHEVEIVEPFADLMGHAGALVVHSNGLIEGATDPRADGSIAGL